MKMEIILILVLALCGFIGWVLEIWYRKYLFKKLKKKIQGKIWWLENSRSNNNIGDLEVWRECLKIIKKIDSSDPQE